MQRNWQKKTSDTVFSCPFLRVDKDNYDDGLGYQDDFYKIHFKDWVHVIPIDSNGRAIMVEIFRFGVEALSLEFPGGQVEIHMNSDETAKKELMEETGYYSDELEYLGWAYPNPAIQSNKCHFYLAKNAKKSGVQALEPAEDITLRYVPVEELGSMVDTGVIRHSLAVLAYYKYVNCKALG